MNVDGLVDWGVETLALVDDPSRLKKLGISAEQMKAKLGWLKEFRDGIGGMVGVHGRDREDVGLRPVPWIDRKCGAGVGGNVAGGIRECRRIA